MQGLSKDAAASCIEHTPGSKAAQLVGVSDEQGIGKEVVNSMRSIIKQRRGRGWTQDVAGLDIGIYLRLDKGEWMKRKPAAMTGIGLLLNNNDVVQ